MPNIHDFNREWVLNGIWVDVQERSENECFHALSLLVAYNHIVGQQPWRFWLTTVLIQKQWIESNPLWYVACPFVRTFSTCPINFSCKDDKISPHHFRGRPSYPGFPMSDKLIRTRKWTQDFPWMSNISSTVVMDCWVPFVVHNLTESSCLDTLHFVFVFNADQEFTETQWSRRYSATGILLRCRSCSGTCYWFYITMLQTYQLEFDGVNWNACIEAGLNFFPSIVLVRSNIVQYEPLLSSHNALAQKRFAFVWISPKMGVLFLKQSQYVLVALWDKRPSVGCDVWIGIDLRKRPQYPLVHCN